MPGFEVAEATPGHLLHLIGQHRFSRYSLLFALNEESGGTVVRAITRAAFPRLRGRIYRSLVIGLGAHRIIVRRMLRSIRRVAEAEGTGKSSRITLRER